MKTGFNILREIMVEGYRPSSLVCMTLKMAPNTSPILPMEMCADLYG